VVVDTPTVDTVEPELVVRLTLCDTDGTTVVMDEPPDEIISVTDDVEAEVEAEVDVTETVVGTLVMPVKEVVDPKLLENVVLANRLDVVSTIV